MATQGKQPLHAVFTFSLASTRSCRRPARINRHRMRQCTIMAQVCNMVLLRECAPATLLAATNGRCC